MMKNKITHFEKLREDKEEMAYFLMCPYGLSENECLPQCSEMTCMACCMEWLDEEAEPDD